ncbi:MAG: hypothetical protein AAF961_08605, partial [Planctomycetota bacterium]
MGSEVGVDRDHAAKPLTEEAGRLVHATCRTIPQRLPLSYASNERLVDASLQGAAIPDEPLWSGPMERSSGSDEDFP